MRVDFKLNPPNKILKDLGYGDRGKVQRFTDTEIAKGMDKYVPFRKGTLKNSVQSSAFGSGKLEYNTPYAKRQYYQGREVQKDSDERGRFWAKRYEKLEIGNLSKKVKRYAESLRNTSDY